MTSSTCSWNPEKSFVSCVHNSIILFLPLVDSLYGRNICVKSAPISRQGATATENICVPNITQIPHSDDALSRIAGAKRPLCAIPPKVVYDLSVFFVIHCL